MSVRLEKEGWNWFDWGPGKLTEMIWRKVWKGLLQQVDVTGIWVGKGKLVCICELKGN